jgi:hypothetical protein
MGCRDSVLEVFIAEGAGLIQPRIRTEIYLTYAQCGCGESLQMPAVDKAPPEHNLQSILPG